MEAVASVNENTVVVVNSVGPIIMENWINHPNGQLYDNLGQIPTMADSEHVPAIFFLNHTNSHRRRKYSSSSFKYSLTCSAGLEWTAWSRGREWFDGRALRRRQS